MITMLMGEYRFRLRMLIWLFFVTIVAGKLKKVLEQITKKILCLILMIGQVEPLLFC